jgi:hypothetical protein
VTRAGILVLVLSCAVARPTLFAQKPVCDDAAVMALRGKWIADSPPRPQNITVEQYQQAAKRTDAAHLLLLEAYPELVGMREGRWWRTVGGSALDGAPGLLSYYYIGGLSQYFCAPNASPDSILGKLGAPSRPVYVARAAETNLMVHFNQLAGFLTGRAGMIIGGLRVFERPRAAGTWKGYDLYVREQNLAGDGMVVVVRKGMLPYRPVTRKQYLEYMIASVERIFDDMVAAEKQALKDPNLSAFRAEAEQRLADLLKLRNERAVRYRAELKQHAADKTLDVPAIVEGEGPDTFSTEEKGGKALVTVNPDYFRKDLPAYVPQVIVVHWQLQEGVASRHFGKLVEANLPIEKFLAMIDR